MVTVILLPRLNLSMGWGGPHLGLMHLVATNVVLWGRSLLQESLHEFHEKQGEESTYWPWKEKGSEEGFSPLHPFGSQCEEESWLTKIVQTIEPVLFAFTIEFVLIGATVFYNMWATVGSPRELEAEIRTVRLPQLKETIRKTDWSNSTVGLLLGLLVFILNIASVIIFYSTSLEEGSGEEFMEKVVSSCPISCLPTPYFR